MREALKLFRESQVLNPERTTAITGELNSLVQLVQRFWDDRCEIVAEHLGRLMELYKLTQGRAAKPADSWLDSFNLNAARGNAALNMSRLVRGHRCSAGAGSSRSIPSGRRAGTGWLVAA